MLLTWKLDWKSSPALTRVRPGWASVHFSVNTVPAYWQHSCREKAEASRSHCGLAFSLRWQINLCPWSVNYCPSHSQPSTASLCTLCQLLPHFLYFHCLAPLCLSLLFPSFYQSLSDFFFPFAAFCNFYEALFPLITFQPPFTLMSHLLFPSRFVTLSSFEIAI